MIICRHIYVIKMYMGSIRLILLRTYNITLGRFSFASNLLKQGLVKNLIEKKKDRYICSSRFFDMKELED